MSSIRLVGALCLALVCATLSYTTFAALIPVFTVQWGLSNTESGIVTGAFLGGYVVLVPLLVSLTDRIDPRRIVLASLALSALSTAGFALAAEGFWSAAVLRFLGGVGLAGTYMPGMKVLSERFSGPAQGRAVSCYAASFYLGLALSVLSAGWFAEGAGWRAAFAANAVETVAAIAIVWFALDASPTPVRRPASGHVLDFRPVLRNRRAMAYIVGYAAHNWEVIGFHGWVVAFLTFGLAGHAGGLAGGLAGSTLSWSATEITTVLLLVSVPAAIFGNEVAQALGRRRTLIVLMTLSAVTALALGFGAGLPVYALLALAGLYAVTTAGDSGGLTAGVVAAAEPGRVGATMALHSTLGFFTGMLGPVAFGVLLDLTGGGATPASWGAAFAGLAAGVMIGPLALLTLGRGTGR